jgi:hypothetical protein
MRNRKVRKIAGLEFPYEAIRFLPSGGLHFPYEDSRFEKFQKLEKGEYGQSAISRSSAHPYNKTSAATQPLKVMASNVNIDVTNNMQFFPTSYTSEGGFPPPGSGSGYSHAPPVGIIGKQGSSASFQTGFEDEAPLLEGML